MVNTWMKWHIFGAESKQPVYIFVVGELTPESGQILCTAVNGYSFYVSQRFVDRSHRPAPMRSKRASRTR